MIQFRYSSLLIISFFLIHLFAASCNSDSELGMSILPGTDELKPQYTDTVFSVNASVANDSIVTTNLSTALLGVVKDDYFGFSTAGFVTQLRPYYNVVFGANAIADSVFLSLGFRDTSISSIYTNGVTSEMKIEIFRLRSPLRDSVSYFSDTDMSEYDTILLSEYTVTLNPKDTLIRVKLPNFIGQMIVDLDSIKTIDDVEKAIPGLLIKPSKSVSNGSLAYLNLNNITNSNVALYYHSESDTVKVSTLVMDSYVTKFNIYTHNYSGSVVEQALSASANGTHFDYIYTQGMNGVHSKLVFPNQLNLQNVVILKAELEFEVFKTNDIGYRTPPDEVILVRELPDGTRGYLPEYNAGYGVTYNSETNLYRFNLTRLVQNWIDGTDEARVLYLLPAKNKVSPNRAVIKNQQGKIRLKISYIKE